MGKGDYIAARAGRYIKQPSGYAAFIPAPLPPEPPLASNDSALNAALSKADRAIGRLDGSINTLPDPQLFLSMFVRREAVLSSQIEGTQASLSDVVMAEANLADRAASSDILEVRNAMRAIAAGTEMLGDLPISTRLIKALHRILMHDVRGQHQQPGEIRTSQNWIGPQNCTLASAAFVPPPPQDVHNALGQLEAFIHGEHEIPALIKAGLIHGQFETIHPFLDGNGRVGRLLIGLYLVERKILTEPVLYLSYYFKAHQSEYYQRLQSIRDEGDWESWLTFFLEGVASVSNLAALTARNLLLLRERDRSKIIEHFSRSSSNALKVLDRLYAVPVTSPNMIMADLATSYPTANAVIAGLESCGIVKEISGNRRNRLYLHEEYLKLFEDI